MFVAEVFNLVVVEEVEDGEVYEYTRIEDSKSVLFKSKSKAEKFLATSSQNEKHLVEVDGTCGCLSNGDDVELVMNFGDNRTAYCYPCS
jgi:hypothetical protein